MEHMQIDADSGLLEIRVSAKTAANSLAASICAAYNEGREIMLSAIGPMPVAQAFKAVCVANRTLASKGVMLAIIPGLITRDIHDKESNAEIPWVVSTLKLMDFFG
jgi:stage V sporulation protein SpoVS